MNPNVSTPNGTGKSRFTIPPLENGDHLTRDEFHRRYQAMPENIKAELIEGVVFMASPVRIEQHGKPSARIITWLGNYSAFTPATEVSENVTVFLDSGNEYQPDAVLRIEREYGGNSFIKADRLLFFQTPDKLFIFFALQTFLQIAQNLLQITCQHCSDVQSQTRKRLAFDNSILSRFEFSIRVVF